MVDDTIIGTGHEFLLKVIWSLEVGNWNGIEQPCVCQILLQVALMLLVESNKWLKDGYIWFVKIFVIIRHQVENTSHLVFIGNRHINQLERFVVNGAAHWAPPDTELTINLRRQSLLKWEVAPCWELYSLEVSIWKGIWSTTINWNVGLWPKDMAMIWETLLLRNLFVKNGAIINWNVDADSQ